MESVDLIYIKDYMSLNLEMYCHSPCQISTTEQFGSMKTQKNVPSLRPSRAVHELFD